MFHHEQLKLYAERADGYVKAGIQGRYLMKPRWYKIKKTKKGEEYIVWRSRKVFMTEMAIDPSFWTENK